VSAHKDSKKLGIYSEHTYENHVAGLDDANAELSQSSLSNARQLDTFAAKQ